MPTKLSIALASVLFMALMILISGCSGTYDISYRDGKLTATNESVEKGCLPGHTNCSSHCVDIQNDDFNCGSCGKICDRWSMACQNSSCVCKPGYKPCNDYCSDFKSDSYNCGGCGNACPLGQKCVNGQCGCGRNLATGIQMITCQGSCVDASIDTDNCGGCGKKCYGSCILGICQA